MRSLITQVEDAVLVRELSLKFYRKDAEAQRIKSAKKNCFKDTNEYI